MTSRTVLVAISLVVAPAAVAAAGQQAAAPAPQAALTRDASGATTLQAFRATAAMQVDGKLTEAIYGEVPSVSDFIQTEPHAGEAATEKTELWVLYDRENLYVSFRVWESRPDRMVLNELRRDNMNVLQNEHVAFLIDTFHDRRNSYSFFGSALGARMDGQTINETVYNGDLNPIWVFKVDRTDTGWTAEAAIPFKSLRYPPGTKQVWGFSARRTSRWKNEIAYLTRIPVGLGLSGILKASFAATLVGLEVPAASRTLELKPYASSNLASDVTARPPRSNDIGGTAGFDGRYAVTDNVTAEFTYNTDFAQVEADEQQVNLTRFSLFFPEKRDFFLENLGTFAFGGALGTSGTSAGDTPVLFYSRRIGLARGQAVPILGGGRLTGRAAGFTVGALDMQSEEDPASGARSTNFSVLRVKRDILRRSYVGVLATRRSLLESGAGSNLSYGVDSQFSLFDNLLLNSYWAKTETAGRHGDDASYRAQLDYNADRWGLQLERLVVEPNFNPDLGFVRRPNMGKTYGLARFSPRPGGKRVRKLYTIATMTRIVNASGRLETREATGQFDAELQNSDRIVTSYNNRYEFLPQPFAIAAGVVLPVAGYEFGSVRVGYNFGQQRRWFGTVSIERGSFYNGTKTTLTESGGRIALTYRLSVEPTLSLNWVDLVQGSFQSKVIGSRVTYTVTPAMFVSALVQYNSAASAMSTNARLRWEYRPGSELFVVYNEQRDTLRPGFPGLANRTLIVKVNRLFRI